MCLTWAPPKEQFKEVESRVLKTRRSCARDSACWGGRGERRHPRGMRAAEAGLTYWFENEDPLVLYGPLALR